jgi:hypothetical protein
MNAAQGTDAWRLERLGKVTASRVADVLATTKSGWSASRSAYAATLIAERLTGIPAPSFDSPEMRWGRETEAQARAVYAFDRDVEVQLVGFIQHPTIRDAGASPDGLLGCDGLLEIKCPTTHQHIELLESQTIPPRYVQQMYFQAACCRRRWGDFMSFDPRLPEGLQCYVKRIEFDPTVTAKIETELVAFLDEIEDKIERLRRSYTFRGVAA